MSIPITRPGKTQLILENPVMAAAGTFGYGNLYRDMVNITKIGAIVTNPATYYPRKPAKGTRTVPLASGVLVHTGMPNPGASKVIRRWRDTWQALPIPTIFHLAATHTDEVRKAVEIIDNVDSIAALELGLPDDISYDEAAALTDTAVRHTERPVLVRLPMSDAYEVAGAVAEAGAGALVVAAPPRGTAHDPISGQLVSGRVYGPMVKAIALPIVERLAKRLPDVPIIGAGGIHSPQDARDYIQVGAVAVQVDSVTWVLPRMIEIIGRDLGGLVITRERGALADEWFTGMGLTAANPSRDGYSDTDDDSRR
jgi:dihydroorotate dehydrogenase (NAD+) catalytic subunit